MDLSTNFILAVAALLGLNRLIFHTPGWENRRMIFWGLQILNLTVIVALIAIGIPGFTGAAKAIDWVLALLLVHHVVTNNGRLMAALNKVGHTETPEGSLKREQLKAALGRGREE
jgi:hypothetical protein